MSRCSPDGAAGHRHRLAHPSISTSIVKKQLLCFRNSLELLDLASFFLPPSQRQINNLTCCSFPVKASNPSSRAPQPGLVVSAITIATPPVRRRGGEVMSAFREAQGRTFFACAQNASSSQHLDKQRDHPNGGGPLIRAPTPYCACHLHHPTTVLLL